ncbi:hypothetical protein QOZ83_06735 [Romboutsia sedimentorum]|uniref:hypothetical protein n=1 Tax=Romboutsia sedimentorum TaxID=1368474 RepID=UPI0024DEC709|nr:hypothetical protein [Romboutsia sedimentorum]MDK2585554.1 hypothetical protein [Romboutsia sedimentorum]
MASSLTKMIMNNISKKALNKSDNKCFETNSVSANHINEKEEEFLKNILHKNNTKINLNSIKNKQQPKNNNSKITIQSLQSFSEKTNNNSVKEKPKDKQNKNMISLKELAK